MKRTALLSLLIAAFIAAGCGSVANRSAPLVYTNGGAPQESMALPEAPAAEFVSDAAGKAVGGGVAASLIERVVLKNADVAIVVNDVGARLEAIDAMAREMGGFVVSSNLYQTYTSAFGEVPEATIVIRVPEGRLDEAVQRIEQDTVEVQSETRSGQDVTATYVDLQSRLKNLEAAEAQLVEILDNAEKTEDVIAVFNQLVYYREQIELVKGQISYYDEAAALSSISVRIIAEETAQPLRIGPWTPKGAYLEAVQDLTRFLRGFADFMIRFVIFNLPALILIALPVIVVLLLLRFLVRLVRKPKLVRAEEPKKETPR